MKDLNDKNIIKLFSDENDCLNKINFYLNNEAEREVIANNGKVYAFENLNYKDIVSKMMQKIIEEYNAQFAK